MLEAKLNIIQTSFKQFKQLGFKNVTMDDLARQSGISKKTIYEHFKDKDELVFEVVNFMLNIQQCQIAETKKTNPNAVEHLFSIITIIEKMIQGINLVCFVDLQRYYPKAYAYLEKHKHEFMLRDIVENLKQGIQEGLYRDDVNVDIISMFRMESSFLMFQSSLYKESKYDLLQVNNELFAHYMYGIATLKGHKLITKYLTKNSKK